MGYFLKNRVTPSGSTGIVIPDGRTADRTAFPTVGYTRFNTDTGLLEFWNGAWQTLTTSGAIVYTVTNFTGDNTTVSFSPLPTSGGAPNQVQVFVSGLYQIPTTNYTVVGNALVFTSAPPLNAPINVISTAN
jgi:hypothetical protein